MSSGDIALPLLLLRGHLQTRLHVRFGLNGAFSARSLNAGFGPSMAGRFFCTRKIPQASIEQLGLREDIAPYTIAKM